MNNKQNGNKDGVKPSLVQLNAALRGAWDTMDRSLLPFMLLGDTARLIKECRFQDCEVIELGVKKSELTHERVDSLKYWVGASLKEVPNGYTWTWEGVPIHLQVITRKYEFFKHPDMIYHMADEYFIPNPFDKYYKARFIIR